MANRFELSLIRQARMGTAENQLALGELYLKGSPTLPRNLASALLWLRRAAQAGLGPAQQLIGQQIPDDIALAHPPYDDLLPCYACAARGGSHTAALTLARLLTQPDAPPPRADWLEIAQAALHQADVRDLPWAAKFEQRFAPSLAHASALETHERPALSGDAHSALKRLEQNTRRANPDACFRLGLMLARIDTLGRRLLASPVATDFPRAIRLLQTAGDAGVQDAWLALADIYGRAEFSGRDLKRALFFLERAASAGMARAQYLVGRHAWRTRQRAPDGDVEALRWLLLAAAQHFQPAHRFLEQVIPSDANHTRWLASIPAGARHLLRERHPLLDARLCLAEIFNLKRAEALLIDIHQADCGHCLVIDIRARHRRCHRRLIPVITTAQRRLLERIKQDFDGVDCSSAGPEGNYRQRLYRLTRACTYFPGAKPD